jgi:hypothetical protein
MTIGLLILLALALYQAPELASRARAARRKVRAVPSAAG